MGKMNETEKRVIALAYFHRYGWIAAMMAGVAIWTERMPFILCVVYQFFYMVVCRIQTQMEAHLLLI